MYKILVIVGCTAVGKSAFALELSKHINMEIISADSVQVYKSLDTATSKPSKIEKQICPHHLVDIVSPFDKFNAYDFVQLANEKILEITQRNKLPVIVGGTGLYVESLLYGFDFAKNRSAKPLFDCKIICLERDREELYSIINNRVQKMLDNGLISEVTALRSIGITKDNQCMQAIGYKQIWEYLDGSMDLATAVENIKKETRNYAKRQITWFKHMNCEFISVSQQEAVMQMLINDYKQYKN